jgi:uncharacterized protein YutE (UPF0331/DUF86 family)
MIKIEGKSGHFNRYLSPAARFREIMVHKLYQVDLVVPDNISFEFCNGEMSGIIRPCGAEC